MESKSLKIEPKEKVKKRNNGKKSMTDKIANTTIETRPSFSDQNPINFDKNYDPILSAAEAALEEGLYDSEGNLDSEEFEDFFDDSDNKEKLKQKSSAKLKRQKSEKSSPSQASHIDLGTVTKKKILAIDRDFSRESSSLSKQLKGLLNRLSIANFESIAESIESLYRSNPRNDVSETLTDLILSSISSQANMLDSFILVFSALVATLSHTVGIEFSAFVLQKIVQLMDNNRKVFEQACIDDDDHDKIEVSADRILLNLVSFLSFLYDLQIVSNKIIGDIITECISRLDEVDTEIILKLIRNCGAQFRRDNPSALKEIIMCLNNNVSKISKESQTPRFKFMVESILDLKNNKQKFAAIQHGELETVKKLLRNISQKRSISKLEPLRIGVLDIRNADVKGKWWLVGGTWAPSEEEIEVEKDLNNSDAIVKLAKEQRMNTEIRKSIFSVLVSSEDCIDAFHRLLKLKLNSRQEREIAFVILHCSAQVVAFQLFILGFILFIGKNI